MNVPLSSTKNEFSCPFHREKMTLMLFQTAQENILCHFQNEISISCLVQQLQKHLRDKTGSFHECGSTVVHEEPNPAVQFMLEKGRLQ